MLIAYVAQVAPSSCPVITTAFAIRRSVGAGKSADARTIESAIGAGTVAKRDRIDADPPGRLNVELLRPDTTGTAGECTITRKR